ncbi:MAG: lipoprotein [Alcaligenaceae bacterium]|nr:lipoprotein [Alcaligenaceae bacterium]
MTHPRPRRVTLTLACLGGLFALAACGQKGPLYMPPPPEAPPASLTTPPAVSPADSTAPTPDSP